MLLSTCFCIPVVLFCLFVQHFVTKCQERYLHSLKRISRLKYFNPVRVLFVDQNGIHNMCNCFLLESRGCVRLHFMELTSPNSPSPRTSTNLRFLRGNSTRAQSTLLTRMSEFGTAYTLFPLTPCRLGMFGTQELMTSDAAYSAS